MMPELTGPFAALLAGLVTSLHCAGMCGPLACSACTRSSASPSGEWSRQTPIAVYHLTRLLSYGAIGAVVGGLGGQIATLLTGGATRGMTWIFVAFFAAVVLGFDKRLRLSALPQSAGRWFTWAQDKGPIARAAGLGLLTPLLPCAPLYMVVAAAALAGSSQSGALLLLAFGFGTVPLLFLVQNRLGWLEGKWSPRQRDYLRRSLALASIVLLLVRGTYTASTGCLMSP
jgi:uncharacterized protein